jgi:hypothetical protein
LKIPVLAAAAAGILVLVAAVDKVKFLYWLMRLCLDV